MNWWITYLLFLLISKRKIRNLLVFILSVSLHYFLFPGLTSIFFEMEKHILSLSLRFYEIFDLFEFTSITESIVSINSSSKIFNSDHEDSYSLLGLIFKSNYRWLILILVCLLLYRVIKYIGSYNSSYFLIRNVKFNYGFLFIAVLFSQFATIYIQAPSLQFIIGISLYPVLYKFYVGKAKLVK